MNGAELLIKTARAAGVEVCFTNAGTTEIPMVLGLDSQPGIKAILGYKTNESPARLSQDTAEAIANSMSGQISTLIVPNDNQLAECTGSEIAAPQFSFSPVNPNAIEKAVQLLRSHRRTALLLGGRALRQRGLQAAARIQAATECSLLSTNVPGYVDRGIGLPDVIRIPYFPEPALKLLSQYDGLVMVGTNEPVTFFGYPGFGSNLLNVNQDRVQLSDDRQNAIEILEYLAEALNAPLHPGILLL